MVVARLTKASEHPVRPREDETYIHGAWCHVRLAVMAHNHLLLAYGELASCHDAHTQLQKKHTKLQTEHAKLREENSLRLGLLKQCAARLEEAHENGLILLECKEVLEIELARREMELVFRNMEQRELLKVLLVMMLFSEMTRRAVRWKAFFEPHGFLATLSMLEAAQKPPAEQAQLCLCWHTREVMEPEQDVLLIVIVIKS